jgi:hypothetical protein
MKIYFRCCEKQQSVSGVQRWSEIPKNVMIKKCWKSIYDGIDANDEVFILHDEVSEDTLSFIEKYSYDNTTFLEVPKHEIQDRLHTFKMLEFLKTQLQSSNPDDIHYIVEDDYLHTPDAISSMKEIFKKWEHFVTTYDYPDRYTMDRNPCYLMVGSDRHWRTNPSGTYTFAAKTKTWLDSWDIIMEHAPHNPTIKMFEKHSCISPVPGTSSHLTPHHMSPIVDWDSLWNSVDAY